MLYRRSAENAMKLASIAGAATLSMLLLAAAHAGSFNIGTVKIEGLPEVRLGDSVEAVQKAFNTTLQPEETETMSLPMPPGPPRPFATNQQLGQGQKTQLHLKTRGVWFFFNKGKVYSIRLDAPFNGSVGGLKLGDPGSKVESLLGSPVKHDGRAGGLLNTYIYYFDDATTARIMVNRDDQVETIFFAK
jgi:hypothetical protein